MIPGPLLVIGQMTSTVQKVALAFEKVRRLNAALWETIDGRHEDNLVERLQAVIAAIYKVETVIEEVDFQAEHLRGLVEIYDGGGRARIYVRQHQTEKWKHLVSIKELCHAVLDRPEDWCPYPEETLGKLLVGEMLAMDAPENNGYRSEAIAEFCAYELAYPHEFRRRDLDRIKRDEASLKSLSDEYQIPEEIVSRVLSQKYLNMCDYYWRMVDAPRGPAG